MSDKMTATITLDYLATLDSAAFTTLLGGIFEHSPWVAEGAYRPGGWESVAALHEAMVGVVERASPERQLDLLCAHPDLAGKASLTPASQAEQAGAGLDQLEQAEYERFQALNSAYMQRFGFPFIIAVKGLDKYAILAAMARRIHHDMETEHAAALAEVAKITRFRLDALLIENVPETAALYSSLPVLEAAVRRDLMLLDYPPKPWMPVTPGPDGKPMLDVAIIGGGQGGLATAFGLMREKISNILVLDENAPGAEGPWLNFARMVTLRTPKHVSGPDLGVPSLTPRAWYSARYGAQAWDRLHKIPRIEWQNYLDWYRQILGLPVRHHTRVTVITPLPQGGFQLTLHNQPELLHARKVVLATGIQGSGDWQVPAFIRDSLPPARYAHTAAAIDFAALAGKHIGVLGAGASAVDNAALALESGAATVTVFARRAVLPRVNSHRWMEQAGFLRHFADLDDARRWRLMQTVFGMSQPPPAESLERCRRHPQFRLAVGTPWQSVRMVGDQVMVETPRGAFHFDFLIIGTGFAVNLALRPELSAMAEHIALWRDRYTPPADQKDEVLAGYPYLGPAFEFMPKQPSTAPWLADLHNFTFGAMASIGLSGASISGLKSGVMRLVNGIARGLWLADADAHYQSLLDFDVAELTEEQAQGHSPLKII